MTTKDVACTDPESSLPNEFRPLMLFEALRKVWMRVLGQRIQRVLTERGLLDSSQADSLHRHTIDTSNLINTVETAQELGTQCYGTSMDMQRAFDSAMKSFVFFCWKRICIPNDISE